MGRVHGAGYFIGRCGFYAPHQTYRDVLSLICSHGMFDTVARLIPASASAARSVTLLVRSRQAKIVSR
jgi:hypothetical protein